MIGGPGKDPMLRNEVEDENNEVRRESSSSEHQLRQISSARYKMARPQNLSSSVSLFIEDSRVAAMANANLSPISVISNSSPVNYYAISSVTHTPNITPEFSIPIQHFTQQQQQPRQNPPQRPTRKPREIIHKIRREGEDEDDNDNNNKDRLKGTDNANANINNNYSSLSSSFRNTNSNNNGFHSASNNSSQISSPNSTCEVEERFIKTQTEVTTSTTNTEESSSSPSSNSNNSNGSHSSSNNNSTSKPTRRRVEVSLTPSTPWLDGFPFRSQNVFSRSNINTNNNMKNSDGDRNDRSFTSVNVTLKSPTNSNGGSITTHHGVNVRSGSLNDNVNLNSNNINANHNSYCRNPSSSCSSSSSSGPAGPSNSVSINPSVTYSSYSNFRDGFESQLQIQIGPNSGSISASRRRNSGNSNNNQTNNNNNAAGVSVQPGHVPPPPTSSSQQLCPTVSALSHQMNADLLNFQRERKQAMEKALHMEKIRLYNLQKEVAALQARFQQIPDMERLKAVNHRLRMECDIMTKQVDLFNNGTVPLGETSEEFYREINPGQDARALMYHSPMELGGGRGSGRWRSSKTKPPRPPPPRILNLSPNQGETEDSWICSMCTFSNHPDLHTCEQCQMTRIIPHPQTSGREQNIRIRFRNHSPTAYVTPQFQQNQNHHQPRHVIHTSWVV